MVFFLLGLLRVGLLVLRLLFLVRVLLAGRFFDLLLLVGFLRRPIIHIVLLIQRSQLVATGLEVTMHVVIDGLVLGAREALVQCPVRRVDAVQCRDRKDRSGLAQDVKAVLNREVERVGKVVLEVCRALIELIV